MQSTSTDFPSVTPQKPRDPLYREPQCPATLLRKVGHLQHQSYTGIVLLSVHSL